MREVISNSVKRRLPRYYRFLTELKNSGHTRISSKELSVRTGFTASQIRQDLNCFGGFGHQGYGYNTESLLNEIEEILGLSQPKGTILIGMGNLGKAITMHLNFESKGFNIIGIFDSKPSLVGQMVRNLPIRSTADIDEFCREFRPEVAILCIPKEAAEEISEQLIALGIKGFLNFSHYDISVKHKDVQVENVHLGDCLMTLSYKLKND